MLYENSKRTLEGWLMHLFTNLLRISSKKIYYVNAFFASYRQVTAKRLL